MIHQLAVLCPGKNELHLLVECRKLKKLEYLDLCENLISELPLKIGKLKNLGYLDLEQNKLTKLPNSMEQLQKLRELYLRGNPLPFNIDEMQSLPIQDKIRTILNIQLGNTTALNEAKILVVGDERVGKTSLIRRLAGLPHDPNQITTEGINISHQQLVNNIQVNIWDFAGQEITHQTHQFFLSNRSLYIYILDAQKEVNCRLTAAIFHWLSVIKAYGADKSPIIVVVNQRDKSQNYYFDLRRYQKDFNIVDVLYTSACNESDIKPAVYNKIEHSITDLKHAIEQRITELDGIDFPLPSSWSKVKNTLQDFQQQKIDFIQKNQYEQICRDCEVTDPADQSTLLRLLNEIGTVVAYPDERRLRLTQVINPLWVTNAVYKIIRPGRVTDGILSEDDIEMILEDDPVYDYTDEHLLWLMDLLNQFELSFSIDRNTLLLPSKLANQEPEFELATYQKGLNFRFSYHNILKKNVISQLTVKLHRHIDQHSDKYWQRGVFLEYGDCQAVVISDENKKTIDIAINNNSRNGRELLTLVREGIKAINRQNLQASEEIPLLIDSEIVGYEDYDFIIDASYKGQQQLTLRVQDPKTRRSVSHIFEISTLIGGYRPQKMQAFNYQQLTSDLLSIAAKFTESRHAIFSEREDQTNNRFRDALGFKNYQVADQSIGGESASGKQAGERDLVIRNKHNEAVSVIEAFILKNCDSGTIKDHYSKLTERYDTTGTERNFIVVYAKASDFDGLWQKYSILCDAEFGGFSDTNEQESKMANIKTGLTLFNGREVVHLFVNFYSQQA